MSARSPLAPPLAGRARLAVVPLLLALALLMLLAPRPARAADGLDLANMTIAELQGALRDGRVSCVDVIRGELERIEAFDGRGPKLNAVITVNPEALRTAAALDAARASGAAPGPAHCVPVLLKDNIETAGLRTTYGSGLFAGFVPADDAPLVARLRGAGAVVVAKSNLDEFAAAVYGISHMAGAMRNPFGLDRTVGGSSGGAAAGVAAGYAPLAIGTDTGGSLRIPAAFTSVVTIRPSMGLVSRRGISPRALTQDTAGPLARTVADAALGLDLIAGEDPGDPLTASGAGRAPLGGYAAQATGGRLDGVRIGLIREGIPLWGGLSDEVAALEERAVADLEAAGATVVPVPQAFVDALDQGFGYTGLLDSGVIGLESRRDLDAYLGGLRPRPPVTTLRALRASRALTLHSVESFDREVDVDLSDPATQADYQALLDRQDDLRTATLDQFAALDVDAFAYPSVVEAPRAIGVEQEGAFTRWSEQTGYPSISVPLGLGADSGLPAGIEFLGRPFGDGELIAIAAGYEAAGRRRATPPTTPATFVAFPQPPSVPGPPAPPAPAPPVPPAPGPGPVPTPRPAPAPRPAPRLAVDLGGAAIRGRGATVRLTLTRKARVSLAVRRGRRTVATTPPRTVAAGRRSVTLRLRRALVPGTYTLVVTARAGGSVRRDAIRLRVRR